MRSAGFKILLLLLLAAAGIGVFWLGQRPADLAPGVQSYGVTFSKIFAGELKLDWRKAYLATLDDLGARRLRLPIYWSEVEKTGGQFDFADADWQVSEAGKRGVKLILAVGQKLPRWPECHIPPWAENLKLEIKNLKLLDYIKIAVERYKNNPAVEYWQVENEPFLKFGECPPLDLAFLDKEVGLVHSLDKRPVIVTDSGELGTWLPAAQRADIFGTTMYRTVWTKNWPGGYFHYPITPGFFYLKANLIKQFAGAKDIIVSELQAEPWGPKQIYEMTPEEQAKSMTPDKFKENVAFANAVGFRAAYLWGVEWWYSEKLAGRTEVWDTAKKLFGK